MKVVALIISLFAITLTPIYDVEYQDNSASEIEIKGNKSFAKFLSHFDKVDLPEDINHTKIQVYKETRISNKNRELKKNQYIIQKDFKGFIPESVAGKFSRIGAPLVLPLERFYPNDNTLAVTYLVRYPFELSGFKLKMRLFDLKGNDKLNSSIGKSKSRLKVDNAILIAGFDVENTISCSFENLNNLTVSTYKNNWEKDQDEYGINDNTVISYERIESKAITISPNGVVAVKTSQPSFASLK